MALRKSALLIEEAQSETTVNPELPKAGLTVVEGGADRVDPYALAMDQVLGLETRPFSTMSRWNSHAIEFAWSLAPMVCDLFSLAVKACVEVQLDWLSWIPGWNLGAQLGAEGSTITAESMDVATGAQPDQPVTALLPFPADAATLAPEPEADADELPEEAAMAAGGMR